MVLLQVEERSALVDLVEQELRILHCFEPTGWRASFPRKAIMYVLGNNHSAKTFECEGAWFDWIDLKQLNVVIDTLTDVLEPEMNEQVERRLKVLRSHVDAPFS